MSIRYGAGMATPRERQLARVAAHAARNTASARQAFLGSLRRMLKADADSIGDYTMDAEIAGKVWRDAVTAQIMAEINAYSESAWVNVHHPEERRPWPS